ncbi:hypothetical protein BDY21DRAFT_338281 [Lineolata rhizophorae]|uniref:Uncharacterized protein n=1 Tax=Lineolata rhizophorae TaxID=578093 RepID=A0A6A6P618_9PEZI|nr:hypothetical protein BDY21DRAFT_338281 [Lineolata rhizophorae]
MSAKVYTGFWIDWSNGKVDGATLTLVNRDAAYLVAFLAVFIGMAGACLWNLVCYVSFRTRSTVKAKGPLHHQKQVILRNCHSEASAALAFLMLAIRSRSKTTKAAIAVLPWVFFAAAHMVGIALAGVFSSRIVNDNSRVLVKGSTCGWWYETYEGSASDPEQLIPRQNFENRAIQDERTAMDMVRLCVGTDGMNDGADCEGYGPRMIKWDTTISSIGNGTSCPFASGMCANNTIARFDSGFLNSHWDFGINTAESDRVEFRRVMECAPLTREGYFEEWQSLEGVNSSVGLGAVQRVPNEAFQQFFYGPNVVYGLNSTFVYSNVTAASTLWDYNPLPFNILAMDSLVGLPQSSDFIAIPELNRTDGDVILFFLMGGVSYTEPVYDPWFSAQKPILVNIPGEGGFREVTVYEAEYQISAMGCVWKEQWCNPATKGGRTCTPLSASINLDPMAIMTSGKQKNIVHRVSWPDVMVEPRNVVLKSRASILLANLNGGGPRPAVSNTTWVEELDHIFGTTLAGMQIWNYRYSGGYDGDPAVITTPLANETWQCDNQIIVNNDYSCFSVLGIALTLAVGGLIIALSLSISHIVAVYEKYRNKHTYGRLEWDYLEAMALQKNVYTSHTDLTTGKASIKPVLESSTNISPESISPTMFRRPTTFFSQAEKRRDSSPISPGSIKRTTSWWPGNLKRKKTEASVAVSDKGTLVNTSNPQSPVVEKDVSNHKGGYSPVDSSAPPSPLGQDAQLQAAAEIAEERSKEAQSRVDPRFPESPVPEGHPNRGHDAV